MEMGSVGRPRSPWEGWYCCGGSHCEDCFADGVSDAGRSGAGVGFSSSIVGSVPPVWTDFAD